MTNQDPDRLTQTIAEEVVKEILGFTDSEEDRFMWQWQKRTAEVSQMIDTVKHLGATEGARLAIDGFLAGAGYDPVEIGQKMEAWARKLFNEYVETGAGFFKRQLCQAEGCAELGEPCWLESHNEPNNWYCANHMHQAGFCLYCGRFFAGIESFDFGPGWCRNCAAEAEAEYYHEQSGGTE